MGAVLQLRVSREALLLDALGAGVLATSNAGAIVTANAAACRTLGVDPAALVGADVRAFIAPIATMVALRRGEASAPSDPKRVYGYTVTDYCDPTTKQCGHVVLFQEISNILELRSQRDRLLQMAALGDALPCILHELKNPVAALSTMLEVMIEDVESVSREGLHALLTEVRRIHLTLQGVGGFAAPLLTDRFEAIDHAVQEACRVLEPTAERRGVTLEWSSRPLPLLPIDRNVVSGVVFNLVRNAIDACGAGNRVWVDTRLEEDGHLFVLSVRDDGPGMSPEIATRCTELFFTSKETGSGIGLALCKQVATSAGGTLHLATALGSGTEVTLRLPLGREVTRAGA